MIKRIFKFIGLACILGLGVYTYLHFSAERSPQNNFHLSYLPQSANWFVEYNDASQLSQDLTQITSSIEKCELKKELLSGFVSLNKEEFKKATLAISDCKVPSVALLVETKQNLKGLTLENWNSKKIHRELWLFSKGIQGEVVNSRLDHLQPFLKESLKMRCINKIQKELEQAVYSIHEVSIEKGKTHLSGFVIDRTKKVSVKNMNLDPRSFSELLPANISAFEWSSISKENSEVKDNQLSEVVCFSMKSSNNDLVALKMKIKTELAQSTFKNSGSKIGAVGNSKWLNDMIPQMKPTTHYSLFKDWVICASSENELKEYANAISNKSWSNSKEYGHLVSNLGMNIGTVSYSQLEGGMWKMGQNAFAINGAYYNIVDIFNNSLPSLGITDNTKEISQKTKPIVALDMEPFEFTNHYTKEKEWVIQDEDLNLVLMTKNKEVIFTKKLDSPVMGEFKMVDALKNNKYQIVFNTENYIYLVDRKGRNVENFPIKLSSLASNELAVIDYEKNENYRLIQALDNGEIENFTIGGNRVKGWKYKTLEKAVIYPITHLKLGNKDYLFTLNEDYEIQLLDRQGQVRHPLDDQPQGLDNFAFEIFEKSNIQESGIRYNSNGQQKEFVFGKGSS